MVGCQAESGDARKTARDIAADHQQADLWALNAN
jgi:hypothetical protein